MAKTKTHFMLKDIPAEQIAEASHITRDNIGAHAEGTEVVYDDGKRENYMTEQIASDSIDHKVAHAQLDFLVAKYGRCDHTKYEGRGASTRCMRPIAQADSEVQDTGRAKHYCSFHLRHWNQKLARESVKMNKEQIEKDEQQAAEERSKALAARAGVGLSRPYFAGYSSMGYYSKTSVEISMDDLEALLAKAGL